MELERYIPPAEIFDLNSSFEDEFLSEEGKTELLSMNAEKWVLRLALLSVLMLFIRTLLWVVDGIFYSNQAEIRLLDIASFFAGMLILWQILDLKQSARRLFIVFSSCTWAAAFVHLIRNYHSPLPQFTPLQSAEYLAFVAWILVSMLFVVYLFQPHVRALYSRAPINHYQRILFLVAVAHFLFFGIRANNDYTHAAFAFKFPKSKNKESINNFQMQCTAQEMEGFPKSIEKEPLNNFCRCESKVLAKYCPQLMVDRTKCLKFIRESALGTLGEKLAFLKAQEACIEQYFPNHKNAIYEEKRKRLQKSLVRKLAFSFPLDEMVASEDAQRKLLHCVTASTLSRCSDTKLSDAYACFAKTPTRQGIKQMGDRCRKLASVRNGDFEKAVEQAKSKLKEGDYSNTIAAAEKVIALGSDHPEGYLIRGECYLRLGKYQGAVEDLIIVLNLSDFLPSKAKALELRQEAYRKLGKEDFALEDGKNLCELGNRVFCLGNSSKESEENLDSDNMGSNATLDKLFDEVDGVQMTTGGENFVGVGTSVKPDGEIQDNSASTEGSVNERKKVYAERVAEKKLLSEEIKSPKPQSGGSVPPVVAATTSPAELKVLALPLIDLGRVPAER